MSYSYDSDLWSLGLTLVECVLGAFPYPSQSMIRNNNNNNNNQTGVVSSSKDQHNNNNNSNSNTSDNNNIDAPPLGFWELLELIVKQPPPVLDSNQFSPELCDF